jgi:hypothetical protein
MGHVLGRQFPLAPKCSPALFDKFEPVVSQAIVGRRDGTSRAACSFGNLSHGGGMNSVGEDRTRYIKNYSRQRRWRS